MNIDFSIAAWGMVFAAFMYIAGNGVWMNHLARSKAWMGWLLWSISALLILIIGAAISQKLGDARGIMDALMSVNGENHWIILTLYALISVPAAASILFRQPVVWTRLAVLLTAIIVFIPLGSQLHDPNDSHILLSLGITAVVCALLAIWSKMLDCEPAHQRKTIPVEEMGQ